MDGPRITRHLALGAAALLLVAIGGCSEATEKPAPSETTASSAEPSGSAVAGREPSGTGSAPRRLTAEEVRELGLQRPHLEGTAPLPPAAILVDDAIQELGTLNPDEVVVAVFEFLNNSSKPQVLERVVTACNCTRVILSDMVFPPHQVTAVTVTIDLRGTVGPFRKNAVFFFEGADQPNEVWVEGEFSHAVAMAPTPIMPGDDGATGELTLRALDGKPFSVLSVNGEPPVFVTGDASPASTKSIRWGREGEPLPSLVVVETDHPGAPVLVDRVRETSVVARESRFVRQLTQGGVGISHRLVNLGALAPGQTVELETTIFRDPSVHREPIEVRFDDDRLTAEVVSIEPDPVQWQWPRAQLVTFRITLSDEAESGATISTPLYVSSEGPEGRTRTNRVWTAAVVREETAQ